MDQPQAVDKVSSTVFFLPKREKTKEEPAREMLRARQPQKELVTLELMIP